MIKAVPWSVKGVEAEARELAREAARRSGLSIGEWLNSVIAEHAADHGLDVDELDERSRLEAVTARLARLSKRVGRSQPASARVAVSSGLAGVREERGFVGRLGGDEVAARKPGGRRAPAEAREAPYAGALSKRNDPLEDDEALLERAVTALDRLESQNNQAAKTAMARLDERLAEIEGLVDANVVNDRGRGERASSGAARRADHSGRAVDNEGLDEMMRQFDRKLSHFARRIEPREDSARELEQLEARVEKLAARASQIPATAKLQSSPAVPMQDRDASISPDMRSLRAGLDRAIADIAKRQQDLDQARAAPRAAASSTPRPRMKTSAAPAPTSESSAERPRERGRDPDISLLRREVASVSRAVAQLAPKGDFESLLEDLRQAARQGSSAQTQSFQDLSRELSALGAKIDAVSTNSADAALSPARRALDQIQEMRELLTTLVEREPPLANVERRLEDLGQRLGRAEPESDHDGLSEILAGLSDLRAAVDRSGSGELMLALDSRFAALARKVDGASERTEALTRLDERLEDIRRELSQKLDSRSDADARLVQSVSDEIDARVERTGFLPEIDRLERLLGDVMQKLEGADRPAGADVQSAIRGMEAKLDKIAERTVLDADALHQAVFDINNKLQDANLAQPFDAERFESLIRDVAERLSAPPDPSPDLHRVEEMIGSLGERLDELGHSSAAPADVSTLVTLVGRLADRIEDLQNPQAGSAALDALRDEIADLGARFARSEAGLRAVAGIERSLDAVMASFADAQQSAVDAAREAAKEIASDMIDGDARPQIGALNQDVSLIRDAQNANDRRVHHTLTVVHDTLEKVVDRLAAVERDMAGKRSNGDPTPSRAGSGIAASASGPLFPPSAREQASGREGPAAPSLGSAIAAKFDAPLVAHDELIEPGSGFAPGRHGNTFGESEEPRSEQSSFIAAARRAMRMSGESDGTSEREELRDVKARARAAAARAAEAELQGGSGSLVQKLRKFAETRKRPLLFGAAAVVLALCSLQIVSALLDHSNAPATRIVPPAHAPTPAGSEKDVAHPGRGQSQLTAPKNTRSAQSATGDSDAAAVMSPAPTSLPTFASTPSLLAPDVEALKTAALRGDVGAQYGLALRYTDGHGAPQNFAAAAQWFQKAALQSSPVAEYRMGVVEEKGLGVKSDVKSARMWYLRAADAGNVRAMHNLAVLTAQSGAEGAPDYATAAKWFKKAAQYGVHDSQYNLAILYARGLGIRRDLTQAYVWFAVAARQGDSDAAQKRDEVGSRLNAGELAAAKAQAAAFRPLSLNAAANAPPQPGASAVASSGSQTAPLAKNLSGI